MDATALDSSLDEKVDVQNKMYGFEDTGYFSASVTDFALPNEAPRTSGRICERLKENCIFRSIRRLCAALLGSLSCIASRTDNSAPPTSSHTYIIDANTSDEREGPRAVFPELESARELTTHDLELHREIYEPFADYLQRLLNGEDPSEIGIGTYSLWGDYLFRTLPGGRIVRVPTSFEEAKQLVHDIHVELGHSKTEDVTATVCETLFVQFRTQLIAHVVHECATYSVDRDE